MTDKFLVQYCCYFHGVRYDPVITPPFSVQFTIICFNIFLFLKRFPNFTSLYHSPHSYGNLCLAYMFIMQHFCHINLLFTVTPRKKKPQLYMYMYIVIIHSLTDSWENKSSFWNIFCFLLAKLVMCRFIQCTFRFSYGALSTAKFTCNLFFPALT